MRLVGVNASRAKHQNVLQYFKFVYLIKLLFEQPFEHASKTQYVPSHTTVL